MYHVISNFIRLFTFPVYYLLYKKPLDYNVAWINVDNLIWISDVLQV